MNKDMLFLVAAVAAVLVMSKKAAAAAAPAPASNSPVATNLNNQLWQNVLGGAWKSLVSGGTSPFLMRNEAGQVTTSDGRPIDNIYSDVSEAISTGYVPDVDVSADGTDWLAKMGW